MKKLFISLLTTLSFFVASGQSLYFPPMTGTWDTTSPKTLNYCQEYIDSLYEFLDTGKSKSFILIKDGKIVLEKYFGNYSQDSIWVWFSAGKSLTSVMVALAQQEGYLDIHDKTSDYLGKWSTLPQDKEDLITIRHQLTMTTGLDEYDFTCTDSSCLKYKADAGTRWFYHNAPYSLLVDVVENATGKNYNLYTQQALKNKIGMTGFWADFGYNHFYWSNARSMARFGLMMLADGTWDGTPIISDTSYFRSMITRSQNLNPSYGYLWWLNSADSIILPQTDVILRSHLANSAPYDMYAASGAQGQFISICPSKGLVIVRQGLESGGAPNFLNEMWRLVMKLECEPSYVQNEDPGEFEIYPNPANRFIRVISGSGLAIQQICVLNSIGQVVLTPPAHEYVDITGLSTGTYFVQITNANGTGYKRFVINPDQQ